jgi:beta-lactamase regulating signal transducer with metallopeptidase domain
MTSLLNGLLDGFILSALVWLLLKLIPRPNAATRYVVWWITLLVVVALALSRLVVGSTAQNSVFSREKTVVAHSFLLRDMAPGNVPARVVSTPMPFIAAPENVSDSATPRSSTFWRPIRVASRAVLVPIAIAWLLASAALLIRLALSYRSLQRLKSAAAEAPEQLQVRLHRLLARTSVARQVRLNVSDEVAAPMALGLFKPVILIPRALPQQLSDEDFDQVALHELAHLRRYDDWLNFLQKLLEALLPIQPAVFWIGRKLSLEREIACDDWVVAVTGTPKPYAACLTRIAELTLWARCGLLASGAAGNPSQLFCRVQRLLDRRRNASPRISILPLSLGIFGVAALLYAALSVPPIVALADSPPAVPTPPVAPAQPFAAAARIPAIDAMPEAHPATQPAGPGTIAQSFTANPGDKLVVDVDQGNVRISAWNQNTVGIVVTQNGPGLAEFLKHHHIALAQNGHEVHVRAWSDGSGSSSDDVDIEYLISVPTHFDADSTDAAGNSEVTNLNGTLNVTVRAGNIQLRGTDGTAVGTADEGNILATASHGSMRLTSSAGNLDLHNVDAAVQAHAGAGNIDAADCTGALGLTAGEGNVHIQRFAGPSIDAQSGAGNVNAELLPGLKADSSLKASMGNVDVKLDPGLAVDLRASAGMGNVRSDFPNGPINGGGPALGVEAGMGNVDIRRK